GGYLRGQILDCVAVGVLSTILMMLVGPRKWALLIGFGAGAVNFIPYLGPATGAVPAVLWALFTFSGWQAVWRALMIVGAFAIVQTVDGVVFQPRIVGRHSQLHPLAVIFAFLVGARFGFGGMIVAIPVAAVVRVLLKEMWWDALADRYRRRQQAE
ncbi:MAG: AI-2E family transporter, partial [Candidatus Sumerlaeota bacterium]|nr:AI-2E family transporter [Candidatus Sumerlaeota bacterium]